MESFQKLRQGEHATIDGARTLFVSRFFDPKRYDLAHVGRYKFNKKLSAQERLLNQKLASDIFDSETGEVLVEEGTVITRRIFEEVLADKIDRLNIKKVELVNPLEETQTYVQEFEVYSPRVNEGDQVVKIIGNVEDECKHITTSDIFASVSYFFNLLD